MERCCLDPAALCPRCIEDAVAHLRGTAENRGHFWAVDVEVRSTAQQRARAWPLESERMIAAARAKVADLGRCPALLDALVPHVVRAASRRWSSAV